MAPHPTLQGRRVDGLARSLPLRHPRLPGGGEEQMGQRDGYLGPGDGTEDGGRGVGMQRRWEYRGEGPEGTEEGGEGCDEGGSGGVRGGGEGCLEGDGGIEGAVGGEDCGGGEEEGDC